MKDQKNNTGFIKKSILVAIAIFGALCGSIISPKEVLAEEDGTIGGEIQEAARIAMATRMMQYCYYKADNNTNSITTGYSLFYDMTSSKYKFRGGAWIEKQVGEKHNVQDGEVYCGESPDTYWKDKYYGSEIIRLFSKYMFGKDDLDTMRSKLFCNKDVKGQPGITRVAFDDKGNGGGKNYDCEDWENTWHFPLNSDTYTYNGQTVNVGSAYIRQLYNEKKQENKYLPDWDDLVGDGKGGKGQVFDPQYDTSARYAHLWYYLGKDEMEAAQCFGTRIKGDGKGDFTFKEVDPATGVINNVGYMEGKGFDDGLFKDDDWDHSYEAADNPGGAGEDNWDCGDYVKMVNGNADWAGNKVKEGVAELNERNLHNRIDDCVDNSTAELNDADATIRNIIDKIVEYANQLVDYFGDTYPGGIKGYPTKTAMKPYLTRSQYAQQTIDMSSDKVKLEDESFIVGFVDQLKKVEDEINRITDIETEDDHYTEEELDYIKEILGIKNNNEKVEKCYEDLLDQRGKKAKLLDDKCDAEEAEGLKMAITTFMSRANNLYSWLDEQKALINKARWDCITNNGHECSYTDVSIDGLIIFDKNNPSAAECVFTDSTDGRKGLFSQNLQNQLGASFAFSVKTDYNKLKDRDLKPSTQIDIDEHYGDTSSTCAGGGGALGWILCPVIEKLAGAADWIYDKTLEPQLEISATDLAMPSEYSEGSGTYQAWQYTVGFANILLSILFMFVIFSQLTGYGIDNYGIKKILPKIIVVAVLINLSYIICQLSVDVSNILGANIQNLLENGIEVRNNTTGGIEESSTVGSFIAQLLGYAGLAASVGVVITSVVKIKDGGLPTMIKSLIVPIVIILVSILIAVVFFFLLLGVRRAGVIVLVILSPLAIACYALPNTKKYFTKWFNGFKGLLVLYPICGLVVGASTLVTKVITANSGGESNFITDILCMFILVYPFFLIPTLVSRTIKSVTSLGDFISGFGNKLRKGSGSALRNSKYLKDAQDRNEANAQENRAKALKNRIDSIDPTKGNRFQRAINRARKEKLIAEQQEAEDKAAAVRDKKYGMWARYRAERDFDKDAGNKGRDYIDAENEARAASKQSEWENRVSGAIFTPERVDYESAKSRAQSRHDAEVTKSFKEQFADMNQGDLETAFKNALDAADINANPDDVNKLRALGSLLIDKGARKELQDALFEKSTDATTGLTTAQMSAILKDTRARNMLADLSAASGSENLKAYAKHLGAHTSGSLSYSDYVGSNVAGKTESLAGYYAETYGQDKDYTSKMDNDDLKFLNGHMDSTDALSGHLNGLMGADTLMKGALTKRGKDLTSLNEMIRHKLESLGGNVDAFVKASGLSDAELASLDASTLEAMCGGDWATLRGALGEKRISEIESDPRLWAKFSEDTRKNLDPSWHFDFNAADAETKWNEMVAASVSADAVRTRMADQITTLKNNATSWGGLPAAFKDKIDPDWRRSERGERLRDGTASAADHTDIATDAAAAFSSSVSDFESFITKQSGFNNGNIKNLTPAVFSDIAGSTVGTAQYNAARELFSKMIDSLPFREWGGLDRTLLSTIKPGWQEEFIKQNALSSDSASLGEANNIIRKAMADAFGKSKADYAAAVNNSNLSADELFKIDFSTLKAYASTPSMEADFRTAIDAAVKDLQSDPTRWAQIPVKKRDFLDPAWRGKPGLF